MNEDSGLQLKAVDRLMKLREAQVRPDMLLASPFGSTKHPHCAFACEYEHWCVSLECCVHWSVTDMCSRELACVRCVINTICITCFNISSMPRLQTDIHSHTTQFICCWCWRYTCTRLTHSSKKYLLNVLPVSQSQEY